MSSVNWSRVTVTTETKLNFRRDYHLRHLLFTEETFQHKARTNLYWLAWLVDQYTLPGEKVFDPMGGAGSILLAATKQRAVITGDVEPHWARIQGQNARRVRTQMLFSAPACVAQWDAANLPIAASCIPAVITSPPYFDLFSDWNCKTLGTGLCYGFHDRQLGNIHVYEHYLRAMRQVYRECWRILRPGGIFVLIVGDRVKRARIVPITADTTALCQANGFDLVSSHQRRVVPSQYRNIHAHARDANYPLIDTETALVFQKRDRPPAKHRFVLVQAPKPNSSPGKQLFEKQLTYTYAADRVLVLTKDGLVSVQSPNAVWCGDHGKARARKDWAWAIARNLVTKHGLAAGDEVELHVNLRYARYLEQRLNSFGAHAAIPTAHCNLGQKLRWYTQVLRACGSRPNEIWTGSETRKLESMI